jgi:hypothetical protein
VYLPNIFEENTPKKGVSKLGRWLVHSWVQLGTVVKVLYMYLYDGYYLLASIILYFKEQGNNVNESVYKGTAYSDKLLRKIGNCKPPTSLHPCAYK